MLDDLGRAVMDWGIGDEVDHWLARRANVELCRLYQATGAMEIFTPHAEELRWTGRAGVGQPLIDRLPCER